MINIAKLLKDAPEGMKLYSPLFGEVEFAEVMDTDYVPVRVMKRGYGLRFNKYGRYMGNEYPDSECLLFPSKDCRTWEGWKMPAKPNFKVGDWLWHNTHGVLPILVKDYSEQQGYKVDCLGLTYYIQQGVVDNEYRLWSIQDAKDGDVLATGDIICIFKKLDKDGYYIISPCIYTVKDGLEIISDENDTIGSYGFKPATKEDRELLFRKMKEVGYEWDEKKKELHKIQPHYDISNFKPFDKVLVRDDNNECWMPSLFGWFDSGLQDGKFICGTSDWEQCIPFNEETKHLLGTTDMPSEEYINW